MAEELRYHKTLRVELPATLLREFKEALPYKGMMSEVIRTMIKAYCKAVKEKDAKAEEIALDVGADVAGAE